MENEKKNDNSKANEFRKMAEERPVFPKRAVITGGMPLLLPLLLR